MTKITGNKNARLYIFRRTKSRSFHRPMQQYIAHPRRRSTQSPRTGRVQIYKVLLVTRTICLLLHRKMVILRKCVSCIRKAPMIYVSDKYAAERIEPMDVNGGFRCHTARISGFNVTSTKGNVFR